MNDIGVVEYSIDSTQNCINAKWYSSKDGLVTSGTGAAKGDLKDGFDGEFTVTYYNQEKTESISYKLLIKRNGDHYNLEWFSDKGKEYFGIGFEYEGKLFAGYRIFSKI